jgi:hypothetical protein
MSNLSSALRPGILLAIAACAGACTNAPSSPSDSGSDAGTDAAGHFGSGSLPTCACYSGNGQYCDSAAESYANQHGCVLGISATSSDLLACSDGAWSVKQQCSNGCTVEGAGTPDQCTAPTCGCYSGDGQYCDSAAQSYASQHGCVLGILSTASDLLACAHGAWSVKQQCSNGCSVEPSGTPDQCTGSNNCSGLSLSGFISKFTGVCTGYPGWSPSNQCTDICLQWVTNVCLPVQFQGNAIDWAGESVQGFTWVPNAPNSVPSPGDIVIFGPSNTDGVGSVGHVDICVSASVSSSTWQGFDQNWQTDWNGSCYPPQLVTHSWNENVLGWQHLTVPIP